MKRCDYCGKGNEETSGICAECGTPFPSDSSAPVLERDSPVTLALTSGLGVLLVGTALFFVIGRILGELGMVGNRVPAHQAVRYSFFTSSKPAPFIALAASPLIFAICRARLADIQRANTTATVSTLLLLALALLPWLTPAAAALWCLPAVMFAMQSSSPAVLYIGAALQLTAGAWLLLLFRARKCNDEPAPA